MTVASGDATARIEVVAHDPSWPAQFEAVAAELRRALEGVEIVGIEHVGSTSVPGLAAKPVLDIDVIVTAAHLTAAIDALVAVGYRHLGEMGVPQREAFREPDLPRRHVYVTVEGSLNVRNHLGMRDVLRSDPVLRDEYGAVKQALAARHSPEEIDHYVAGKSEIVQRILRRAGIGDDELAELDEINRLDA